MAKSYNNISNELINDAKLLRLNLHILALGYLEKEVSHFIELSTKDKDKEEDDQLEPQISNLKKEKIK